MRLGKTFASALAVLGGGGVAGAFLVSGPKLSAAQWLGILLTMQTLRLAMWGCAAMTAWRLRLKGSFGLFAAVGIPVFVVGGLLQMWYTIAAFPDHAVAAQSSTWWWLVADGAFWALEAVVLRELFFVELLERFPTPWTLGPAGTGTVHEPNTGATRSGID
jgi:hypothetical protein